MMLDVFAVWPDAQADGDDATEREDFLRGQMLCAWSLLAALAAFLPLWLLIQG